MTPWTVAHQAPLSMGFSRKEYWRGLPFPPPGDLPNPGIEPWSLLSPQLAGGFFTTSTNSVVGEKKNSIPGIYLESTLTKRLCRKVFILGYQMAYTTVGWEEATDSMLGFQE